MFSIQGLGRHKLFCTGLKLCPVCKIMIKILDFETHLERCKNANASPSLTGSPIQTHRILKNIAAKTKPRTSQVRVNHSHTSAVSERMHPRLQVLSRYFEIEYKQLFQKNPPKSFVSTRNGSDRRLTVYRPVSSSKVNLYTSWHHLFGTEWAKQEFGSNWRSAKCRGKLGKYNTKSKMWGVRYATIVMYIFQGGRLIPFTE